jgi:predicted nucleotide-binding protein
MRLELECEEFNSESAAGISTVERLKAMLNNSRFAFLVFTGEDERADGTRHPRENVVHEAGLFAGRLGFERAIILMEEGCTGFSNIHGLTHIPFPAGRIAAAYEEVRRVLQREGVV